MNEAISHFAGMNVDNLFSSNILVQVVAWVYVITNLGRVVFYIPQIITASRCENGARAVSYWTWGSFAVSHLFATAYGVVVIKDIMFAVVSFLNFVCSFIIFALVVKKQVAHQKEHAASCGKKVSAKPVS